ncbi:hypothetical protein A6P54_13085 [Bacillus sp. MKU004]|nr:hypothetical protein A6P54_13085 [Bacillus sp. MKU004]
MKKWRERRKVNRQRKRKHVERFSIMDFLFELLFWIPELLLFPFRLVFWLFRGVGKLIGEVWNFH